MNAPSNQHDTIDQLKPQEKTRALETLRALLAEAILRLQRVEREEKEREDELHAPQSGETRTRRTSEGVAVEQSSVLFDRRERIVCAESGVGAERVQEKNKSVKNKGRGCVPNDIAYEKTRSHSNLTPAVSTSVPYLIAKKAHIACMQFSTLSGTTARMTRLREPRK
jgi:hypothetical protein